MPLRVVPSLTGLPSKRPKTITTLLIGYQFSSVAQSCLTLRPHGLQHTRLPCPWDFPGKSIFNHGDADSGEEKKERERGGKAVAVICNDVRV